MGGIGNQLFQVAAARHVAQATGATLALADKFNEGNAHGADERESWYFRHIPALPAEEMPSVVVHEVWGQEPHELVARVRAARAESPEGPLVVVIRGYFQSEAFFASAAEGAVIRDWFTAPRSSPGSPGYALHIRRGDYRGNGFHEVLTCGDQLHPYYREARALFPPGVACLVFSDDPEWCQTQFPGDPSVEFVDATLGSFESLQLMSQCSLGLVMANSSFSWWAAWLNDNPHKVIVMPGRWFGDSAPLTVVPQHAVTSYRPHILAV